MMENIRKKLFLNVFTLSRLSAAVNMCSSRHLRRSRSREDSSAPSWKPAAIELLAVTRSATIGLSTAPPLLGSLAGFPSAVAPAAALLLSPPDPWRASNCWSRTTATDVCDSRWASLCTWRWSRLALVAAAVAQRRPSHDSFSATFSTAKDHSSSIRCSPALLKEKLISEWASGRMEAAGTNPFSSPGAESSVRWDWLSWGCRHAPEFWSSRPDADSEWFAVPPAPAAAVDGAATVGCTATTPSSIPLLISAVGTICFDCPRSFADCSRSIPTFCWHSAIAWCRAVRPTSNPRLVTSAARTIRSSRCKERASTCPDRRPCSMS